MAFDRIGFDNSALDLARSSWTYHLRAFAADARHFQLSVLGSLILYQFAFLDFGARPVPAIILILSVLATQLLFCHLTGAERIEWRSVLITSFSLTLLLRAPEPGLYALAGFLAVSSKYIIRWRGKHIFNPATFAIVALLLAKSGVWTSPGQWGNEAWLTFLLAGLGMIVVWRATRMDIALFFVGAHAALLLGRALWLGDPLSIPAHQLQSGALVLFSFFMITDPRTIPDSRLGRLIFALGVAGLAHYLIFFEYRRPGLYLALAAWSLVVPLIDWLLPAKRFQWINKEAKP